MLKKKLSTTAQNLDFDRELARYGPSQAETTPVAESLTYCSRWAKLHYENFVVASILLPRKFRQDFHNIYAYCRWSDNLADEIANPQQSLLLLDWWQTQLNECFNGSPRHPVMVALQQTVRKHKLLQEPFVDLLSAFRQDQQLSRYRDDAQLLDYCRRSANPVGRIVLELAGSATAENIGLSDRICTGLQLANFCQDLARDAEQGRIYVPQTRWIAHDVVEAMFLQRQPTKQLRSMLADWVVLAKAELTAGHPLVRQVPRWLRADLELFIGGGWAILETVARCDYDVWSRRPQVSKWTQLRLLCSCWLAKSRGIA